MTRPTVIVTGGAGYLGRSIASIVHREGYMPVLVDNLSNSRAPTGAPFPFHQLELCDYPATLALWEQLKPVHAVVHFAAKALVPESCEKPELYFRNNLLSTLNAAEASLAIGCRLFVHSSSCAVYGMPQTIPIPEQHPKAPISPYGETKWMAERMLAQLSKHRGLQCLNLRYFNPAGAIHGIGFGECHDPETHLIPNVVRAALRHEPIFVYGDDYPTPDGTCIRDFIHVEDLATAHVAAIRYLENPNQGPCEAVNLGLGNGVSVKEVLGATEQVLGTKLNVQIRPRRPGDPPRLVADAKLAYEVLRWKARLGLPEMLRSHAEWIRE